MDYLVGTQGYTDLDLTLVDDICTTAEIPITEDFGSVKRFPPWTDARSLPLPLFVCSGSVTYPLCVKWLTFSARS